MASENNFSTITKMFDVQVSDPLNNTEFNDAVVQLQKEFIEAMAKINIDYQKSYPNVTEVHREWDIIYDAWQEVMNRLQADRDAAEIADLRARRIHITRVNGSTITIMDRNPNVNPNVSIIRKNVTSVRRLSETVKLTTPTTISSVSIGLSVGIPALVFILIFFIIKKF